MKFSLTKYNFEDIVKSCGKCPAPEGMTKDKVPYKCTDCIGNLCNEMKSKGQLIGWNFKMVNILNGEKRIENFNGSTFYDRT